MHTQAHVCVRGLPVRLAVCLRCSFGVLTSVTPATALPPHPHLPLSPPDLSTVQITADIAQNNYPEMAHRAYILVRGCGGGQAVVRGSLSVRWGGGGCHPGAATKEGTCFVLLPIPTFVFLHFAERTLAHPQPVEGACANAQPKRWARGCLGSRALLHWPLQSGRRRMDRCLRRTHAHAGCPPLAFAAP